MMSTGSALLMGGFIVFVAVIALGFILWQTTSISERCSVEGGEGCEVFTGASFPVLILTLIIAGLVLVSSTVVYILVTR